MATIMSLHDEDGHSERIELPGPGGKVYLVVGEKGRQSSVWRIFSPRNTDVYIGVRSIMGYQKWSLHESGDWRYQWLTHEKAKQFGAEHRVIDQWEKPEEEGDSGLTRGFSIRVRHEDLVETPQTEDVPEAAVWLPSPPERAATCIHIAIARPTNVEIRANFIPLGGYTLADGRIVVFAASVERIPDAQNKIVDGALAEMVSSARVKGVELETATAPRGVAFGNVHETGHRFVWDVSLLRHLSGPH
jgi:hypothetical protein